MTELLDQRNTSERVMPIGGYFELENSIQPHSLCESAMKFQSARAAFAALLRTRAPRRIWIPRFICDSMLAPLYSADVEVCFYDLNADFSVDENLQLQGSDWLLFVNYFGLYDALAAELVQRFDPRQLVADHAHALFSPPPGNFLATIYSPRKFLGMPDGGLMITSVEVPAPAYADNGSVDRCRHLLLRADDQIAAGHAAFKIAEASLANHEPLRMSPLSHRIYKSTDMQAISIKRRRNFMTLHSQLGHINQIPINLSSDQVPLCYPFMPNRMIARQKFYDREIFFPTYWPEVLERSASHSWEHELTLRLICLPCDQRYSEADMTLVATVAAELLSLAA